MREFKYKGGRLRELRAPLLCGILNVTPDSFSDGGRWICPDKAIDHAMELLAEGASMIDIGGESTRPGSEAVSCGDEIERIVPVIRGLRARTQIPISVDTWKSEVAIAALEAGADIINDVTGLLGDENMADVIAKNGAGLIAMFNPVLARPRHEGSKIFPSFGSPNVFREEDYAYMSEAPILACMDYYFEKSLERAYKAGLAKENIMLDPGIGFGLTKRENLELIEHIHAIHDKGFMAFLGLSRKRFVVNLLEEEGFNVDLGTEEGWSNRDRASAFLSCLAAYKGVEVLRVHTLREHRMGLIFASALRSPELVEDRNFGAYKNTNLT